MAIFTVSIKVKCPKCGREWYTFRFDDICPECENYLSAEEFESCVIGEGTAEDVVPKKHGRRLKGK